MWNWLMSLWRLTSSEICSLQAGDPGKPTVQVSASVKAGEPGQLRVYVGLSYRAEKEQ